MLGVIFIGDELSAAGFRLAGCDIATPGDGDTNRIFDAALVKYSLIMVSAAQAQQLSEEALEQASEALTPLVVVIPDIAGQTQPEDLATRIRTILGVET